MKYGTRVVGAAAAMLLFATEVLAQEGAAPQPPSMVGRMLPLFFIVFFIFYFLVIRPQDKKMREQEALLKELKKGDNVITSAGIIGRVAGLEKDYILLEISNNVRMKVQRSHIVKPYVPSKSKGEGNAEKKSKNAA